MNIAAKIITYHVFMCYFMQWAILYKILNTSFKFKNASIKSVAPPTAVKIQIYTQQPNVKRSLLHFFVHPLQYSNSHCKQMHRVTNNNKWTNQKTHISVERTTMRIIIFWRCKAIVWRRYNESESKVHGRCSCRPYSNYSLRK